MTTTTKEMTCREWLSQNNYEDALRLIDEAMAKMAARGSKQRRNWWETLAGGVGGRPLEVEGIEFPVLQVAQRHMGKPVTPDALCRNPNEDAPPARQTARWPKKKSRPRKSKSSK